MTSIVSIVITIIAILFSKPLMGIFTNDSNVIDVGAKYLIIVSSFYIVFSTMFVLNGVMRGAGDTLVPMFITLIALWAARIPLSYWLSRHLDEEGIWWAIPIGWLVGMVLSWFYYLTGKWKTKGVVDKNTDNLAISKKKELP